MAWVCVELGGVAPNEMRRGRGGLETVLRLLALLEDFFARIKI